MWQIVLAANFLYSANETIRAQDIESQAPLLQFFGQTVRVGGAVLTFGAITMLAIVLLLAYALRHTAWGRHVYAVGDDPEAAELAGVQVKRVLISVYTLAGLICAIAGWALIGRLGSVSPTSGQFENINSITAVVIGGTLLSGGRGGVLQSAVGTLILAVLANGMIFVGITPDIQKAVQGAIILAASLLATWHLRSRLRSVA